MQIPLENRLLRMNISQEGKDALEEEQTTDLESNSGNRRSNLKTIK
jgi:hypothetical protein